MVSIRVDIELHSSMNAPSSNGRALIMVAVHFNNNN